jgi:hypothetical protein
MSGVVIDIASDKDLYDSTEFPETRGQRERPVKLVLEIAAPDGRNIFSIGRLLNESESGSENLAA